MRANRRVAESYPTDHYNAGNRQMLDYRMGYRDIITGELFTTREGTVLAVPNATMPALPRRRNS